MPYVIERRGNKHCVVSTTSGKTHGCHPTREKAIKQQRALYANAPESSTPADSGGNMPAMSALAEVETENVPEEETWDGVLATIGSPTSDGRYLIPGEISHRDLPVEMHMQPALAEGHMGAVPVGRIDEISYIPFSDFERKDEFYSEEQIAAMSDLPHEPMVVFGEGAVNGPHAEEAKRRLENGADVSLDGLHYNDKLYDASSFEEVDTSEMELMDVMMAAKDGKYLAGVVGKIGGVTIVSIGAFEEAKVGITASASIHFANPGLRIPLGLVAAAGPLKPPREWFDNPHLQELTPLQITKEGRVFGHLCDWDGCHIGFQGICVPPFRSPTNYANFNTRPIETAEGAEVECGKIMFSREGVGHAPLTAEITLEEVRAHYDDATCVGAFVRAGEDKFGTWLAGALRSDLNDLEIQHMRTHGPSGDWRPIPSLGNVNDLVAAIAVPIQGFPIVRQGEALVASANGHITGIITAPLVLDHEVGEKARFRRRALLVERAEAHFGRKISSKARMRREMMDATAHKTWYRDPADFKTYTTEQRKRMAKAGTARKDGSYPIADCEDWDNARQSVGRTPPAERPAVRAWIAKRGRALGCKA